MTQNKVLRHLLSILALPVVVAVVVPFLLLRSPRLTAAVFPVPGVVLMSVGLALMATAIHHFARRGRGTLAPWDPPRRLVVSGVYRHVRNPMISGVVALLTGQGLFFGSPGIAVWTLAVILLNAIYIPLVEEKALARRFGRRYDSYRRNVPRWLPRLTPWHGEDNA